jgi:15-cis-phytoene synthase
MLPKLLPRHKRSATYSLYAFCRLTDNIVDDNFSKPSLFLKKNISNWKKELETALKTKNSANPVLNAFAQTVEEYKIDHKLPFELIKGVEMDITKQRYDTFKEFEEYCYLVASVVGLMMCQIIGYSTNKALEKAIILGKAMQLTNNLRDIWEDYNKGRIYLPREDLENFGYTEQDLKHRRINENYRQMMKAYIQRARRLYSEGEEGLKYLDPSGRFSIKTASILYSKILDGIEKNDYDIFSQRIVVSGWDKFSLALKLYFNNKFLLMKQQ